jgi:hypothetical protein
MDSTKIMVFKVEKNGQQVFSRNIRTFCCFRLRTDQTRTNLPIYGLSVPYTDWWKVAESVMQGLPNKNADYLLFTFMFSLIIS